MTRGYLLISFGKAYIHEAVNLSKLLNKFGNKYPISIICSKDDFDYVKSFCIFGEEPVFTEKMAKLAFSSIRPQLEYGNKKSEIAKTNNFKLKESITFLTCPLIRSGGLTHIKN